MDPAFKARLAARERLIGTLLTLPSPEVAEIFASSGFDFLLLDMEHGLLDVQAVQRLVQVIGGRCPGLVRVPLNEEGCIKKVLDIGVSGLMVPQVNTPELARLAVRFCKYPPQGTRSVGINRAHGYGPGFQGYVDRANQDTSLVVQIEHIQAVENVEAIIRTPGVDAALIGPYDLSASMGKIGQLEDPEVQRAIQRVRTACAACQFPLGIYYSDPVRARQSLADGFSFAAVLSDILLLSDAATSLSKDLNDCSCPHPRKIEHE
jgi:2-dehydro-3-deoxyglucarate aldolase/4-hydroxy-2-oxoheptanedioate aldolase